MSNYTCQPISYIQRLTCRPRVKEFGRVLKNEVYDPLWMLSRQWQFGEFKADDAGSPVLVKTEICSSPITDTNSIDGLIGLKYSAETEPLNTRIEAQEIRFDLRSRIALARQFMKLYAIESSEGKTLLFEQLKLLFPFAVRLEDGSYRYGIKNPNSKHEKESFSAAVALSLKIATRKSFDGKKFYDAAKQDPDLKFMTPDAATDTYRREIKRATEKFVMWVEQTYTLPKNDTWNNSRMEYSTKQLIEDESSIIVLNSEEYDGNHLDWYNFDITGRQQKNTAKTPTTIITTIPDRVAYTGMPAKRWWEMEDGSVNFCNLKTDLTNTAKVLLTEFALMFSNDWFSIPFDIASGAVTEVKGMVVTDVFGDKTMIRSALDKKVPWYGWTMFSLRDQTVEDDYCDQRMLVLPVTHRYQESAPIEEVYMGRDEMTNMVWGVEKTFFHPVYGEVSVEDSLNLNGHLNSDILSDAPLTYDLFNGVAKNWIPFAPVRLDGDSNFREIILQRAAMPQWDGSVYTHIRPNTQLLRAGIDDTNNQQKKLTIYEEEVPRSGIRIASYLRMTRWYHGKRILWCSNKKKVGRGESASSLEFDKITENKLDR